MYVNISRSKHLINNRRYGKKAPTTAQPSPKCNHCGGLVRENGEIEICLMCGREKNHNCSNCQFKHASEVKQEDKKSA